MRMRHIVICGVSGCKFPYCLVKERYSKKIIEHEISVEIFCTNFVGKIFHSEKQWTKSYMGLHVEYLLILSGIN